MKQELQRRPVVGGIVTQLRTYLAPLVIASALAAGYAAGRWSEPAPACLEATHAAPPEAAKPAPSPVYRERLIIPVRGVSREDTWGEAGGREGVDPFLVAGRAPA